MDPASLAPLVRGLALSRSGPAAQARAVVASKALAPTAIPAGAFKATIGDTASGGEAGLAAALAAALPSGAGLPFLLAAVSGAEAWLFAAARSLDEAKALLDLAPHEAPGARPGPGAPVAGARPIPGSAAARSQVVDAKVCLVTGGAQGFGEEIVRGLAASGALVWVADMNMAGAEKLSAELNASLGRTAAIPLAIDVSREDSVAAAFDLVARTTGGLDLVVSNAGVLKAASVLEQDLASFDFVTKVNYTGFFLVSKHAGRILRLQALAFPGYRTDIVQVNSKSGLAGSNKNGAYAGSKFGGLGLVQSFALELVEFGVKVNAICPGNFFDGPLWSDPEKGLFVQYLRTGKVPGAKTIADVKAFYEAKVPMGRGCEGPDVMRALYYLVEQEYETGQALPVTGGQVMLN